MSIQMCQIAKHRNYDGSWNFEGRGDMMTMTIDLTIHLDRASEHVRWQVFDARAPSTISTTCIHTRYTRYRAANLTTARQLIMPLVRRCDTRMLVKVVVPVYFVEYSRHIKRNHTPHDKASLSLPTVYPW